MMANSTPPVALRKSGIFGDMFSLSFKSFGKLAPFLREQLMPLCLHLKKEGGCIWNNITMYLNHQQSGCHEAIEGSVILLR